MKFSNALFGSVFVSSVLLSSFVGVIWAGAALADQPAAGMKTAEMHDPHFQNMAAIHVVIPSDWNFSGVVLRPPDCKGARAEPEPAFRTQSKDSLMGVQFLPSFNWINADVPRVVRRVGVVRCPVYDDISIKDMGTFIAAGRPNARLIGVTGAIDGNFAANLKLKNDQLQASSPPSVRAMFPAPEARGEQGRVRIAYQLNGHPVEEWIVINKTIVRWQYAASVDNMGRGTSWDWIDYYHVEAFGLRAPQGKLDSEFARLLAIRRSIEPDGDWYRRESTEDRAYVQKVMQQTDRNIEANYEALHRQAVEIMRGAQAGEDAANRHGADVVDMLAGRQFVQNTATGQTGYVPLGHETGFQNSRTGEVVSSSNSNFDPNEPGQNWTDPGDWDRLRPISH